MNSGTSQSDKAQNQLWFALVKIRKRFFFLKTKKIKENKGNTERNFFSTIIFSSAFLFPLPPPSVFEIMVEKQSTSDGGGNRNLHFSSIIFLV